MECGGIYSNYFRLVILCVDDEQAVWKVNEIAISNVERQKHPAALPFRINMQFTYIDYE